MSDYWPSFRDEWLKVTSRLGELERNVRGGTGGTGSVGPIGPQGPKGDTGATGPAGTGGSGSSTSEVAYAQTATTLLISVPAGGSSVVVPNLSISVTVGTRPVMITARASYFQYYNSSTSGNTGFLEILRGGIVVGQYSVGENIAPSGQISVPVLVTSREVTEGTFTYTFRVRATGPGVTCRLAASGENPISIQAVGV